MQTIRRPGQTFDEMRRAADEGDAAAQCYLGICFQTGQGVTQDYAEAVRWFRRAADRTIPTPNVTSASVSRPAPACPRNTARQPSGFAKQPSKATRRPSSTWGCFMK